LSLRGSIFGHAERRVKEMERTLMNVQIQAPTPAQGRNQMGRMDAQEGMFSDEEDGDEPTLLTCTSSKTAVPPPEMDELHQCSSLMMMMTMLSLLPNFMSLADSAE
jgi:hypothetical protein